jgi:tetratricopeptide (TPR) repeat protein
MTTLYDMLDVRPDDDAETVKDAFRKAAKVSHPDLNADDPDAAARFKEVVRANAILNDPELRAVYDRMLEFERQQHQSSSVAYNIVPDAIVVVVLAIVMAGAYTLYTNLPEISVYLPKIPIAKFKVAADTAREPSAAVVRPSPVEANTGDSARKKLENAKNLAPIPAPGAVVANEAAHAPVNASAAPSSLLADAGASANPSEKPESTGVSIWPPAPSAVARTENGVVTLEDVTREPATIVRPSPPADTSANSNPRDQSENAGSRTPSAVARTANGVVSAEGVTHAPGNAAAVQPSPPAGTSGNPRDRDEGASTSVPSAVTPAANGGDAIEKPAPAPSAVTPPTAGPAAEKNLSLASSGSAVVKDAKFYREQGIESYRNGDLPVAIADFDRAIRLDPNFKEAYIDRGIALYRLRKFDRAFADVAQAMRIENSHRTATPPPKAHSN